MPAPNAHLPALSDEDQQWLRWWLAEFDRSWNEDLLAAWISELPAEESLRQVALAEMVKLDMCRRWHKGRRVVLEAYLRSFPDLGTAETVSVDLIHAEYQLRQLFGVPAHLIDFTQRFPQQAHDLARILSAEFPVQSRPGPNDAMRDSAGIPSADTDPQRSSPTPVSGMPALSSQKVLPSQDTEPDQQVRISNLDSRLAPGGEIVPGYKLTQLLGRGGYGEVWEATAPGGKPIALKIVRNFEHTTAQQEFRALEFIKAVDHNHLMEIQAYWLLDGQGAVIPDELREHPNAPKPSMLVMASQLAGKNLLQRLRECQKVGLPGIPISELLVCMRQSADAIDYLNSPVHPLGERMVSIQHRDIKPENILLVGNIAKVCDFGLAKVLEGTSAAIHSNSVGMTIDYAAPEVLTGSVSAWTDQYALALTYYKLRTGMAPFQPNLAPYSRLLAHVEGTLDLSHLPAGEEAVIRRATALIPEERWTNCTEMVQALVEAIRGAETGEPEEAPPEQVTRKNVSSPRITVRPAAAKEEARQNAAPVQPPPPQPRTLPRVPPAYRWRPGARKNSTTGVLTVIVLLVALAVLAGLIVWRATHPRRPALPAPPTGKTQSRGLEPWASEDHYPCALPFIG